MLLGVGVGKELSRARVELEEPSVKHLRGGVRASDDYTPAALDEPNAFRIHARMVTQTGMAGYPNCYAE